MLCCQYKRRDHRERRKGPRVSITKEVEGVRGELIRVDNKASTLAGLTGAAVAFIATQVAGSAPLRLRWAVDLSLLGLVFICAGLVAGVIA